jgi:hypothetical protein
MLLVKEVIQEVHENGSVDTHYEKEGKREGRRREKDRDRAALWKL